MSQNFCRSPLSVCGRPLRCFSTARIHFRTPTSLTCVTLCCSKKQRHPIKNVNSKTLSVTPVTTPLLFRQYLVPLAIRGYFTTFSMASEPKQDHVPEDQPLQPQQHTAVEKLKIFFRKYGRVGIAVYILLYGSCVTIIYFLLKIGVDVPSLLQSLGFHPNSKILAAGSTFFVALAINKLLFPLRLALTALITPLLVRIFKRLGLLSSKESPANII
jgi:hypothetical protein